MTTKNSAEVATATNVGDMTKYRYSIATHEGTRREVDGYAFELHGIRFDWKAAVEICIDVLQDPSANVGQIICAKESLRELARNAEELKAHIGQISEALDEATRKEADA